MSRCAMLCSALMVAFCSSINSLAIELCFSGVCGQSAPPDKPAVRFLGASSLITAEDGRIYMLAAGSLYCIGDNGTLHFKGKVPGDRLEYDGKDLYSISGTQVCLLKEVKDNTTAIEPLFGFGETCPAFAVCPAAPDHGFTRRGKFFAVTKKGELISWDSQGRMLGKVFDLPGRRKNAPVTSISFLPGTDDLVIASEYPDLMAYRVRPDGDECCKKGWPVPLRGGSGRLQITKKRLWHLAAKVMPLDDTVVSQSSSINACPEYHTTGVAFDGKDGCYLASTQGIRYRSVGRDAFAVRIGGVPLLQTIAINRERIYFSVEGRYGFMLLDDQFDEPLKSDGESWNRINGSYDNPVVDDVPFGSGLLVVGQAGDLWRFNHDSVALNCRPQWSRVVILPPTEKMSAVAADVSTRRIWLAGNGRIYETELSAASEMKLTEVVAERTFPKVERLAALSGDTLMFSAEKETGALERNKEGRYRLLWTVSFPKKVVDIAAMEKAVIVAMEDSLAVLAPTTGQCVFVLTETSVAGGFEISRIAMDSKWLVVGDTKNYRIVRFKIKD